jgi:hypothetical protein
LKRAEIKKEESGMDEEMLSRSLDCISFVKLLRPALPKPKYVPSDNPSLLGRPVKDFKKFRKQVSSWYSNYGNYNNILHLYLRGGMLFLNGGV